MNVYDFEWMKGMFELFGYMVVGECDEVDLIFFNICLICEVVDSCFIVYFGYVKWLKSEDFDCVVGVGGCWV